jgi:hypothetical protein
MEEPGARPRRALLCGRRIAPVAHLAPTDLLENVRMVHQFPERCGWFFVNQASTASVYKCLTQFH